MYFVVAGQHPAFGYVDQPPLTPLLSAASVALLGVSPTAVRMLPALEMALVMVLVALIARDLGGSRRAQVLAAITAALSGYLGAGHLTPPPSPTCSSGRSSCGSWCGCSPAATGGSGWRWASRPGIGLENKDTLLFLALGSRWARPRPTLGRRPLAVGVGGARDRGPYLGAQPRVAGDERLAAAHDGLADRRVRRRQPRPGLAVALALHGAAALPGERRGSGLDPGTKAAAPWRAIGIAALVALALAIVSGGKAYYAIGSVTVFMAAGAILLDRWLTRGHPRLKAASFAAAAALSGALIVLLTLPILPVADLCEDLASRRRARHRQPDRLAAVRRDGGGGGRLAACGTARPRGDPDEQLQRGQPAGAPRQRTAAGLLGPQRYWNWGPPPADRTVVIHVGDWRPADWSPSLSAATTSRTIDNGLGIKNGEQGKAVSLCTGTRASWSTMWPALRTIS